MESTNNKDFTVYYKISSAFTEYCQQTTLVQNNFKTISKL
jgi:hypothetical protein